MQYQQNGDFEGVSKDIIQLKSLAELIHLYNSHIDIVADFIQKLVFKNSPMLIRLIQAELRKMPVKIKGSNRAIQDLEIYVHEITDAWVVASKGNTAVVSLEYKFEISGKTRGQNEDGYIVDDQDYQQEFISQAQIKVRFNQQDDTVFFPHDLRFSEELQTSIEVG